MSITIKIFWTLKHIVNFRILAFPAPNLELYKHCITIESRIAEMGCKEAEKCVQSLFQSVVDKYSQDTDLWLAYYSHEIKVETIF